MIGQVSKVVVDAFVERVKEDVLDGSVTEGVEPGQQFIKIVYDELKRVMGGDEEALMADGDDAMQARAEVARGSGAASVTALRRSDASRGTVLPRRASCGQRRLGARRADSDASRGTATPRRASRDRHA